MIGTTLQNRYHLEAELGQGGMGTVYRAYDTLLDRPVALDATWSDGTLITAHDFEFSWRRVLDPATAAMENAACLFDICGINGAISWACA